jgi:hypothetical protein
MYVRALTGWRQLQVDSPHLFEGSCPVKQYMLTTMKNLGGLYHTQGVLEAAAQLNQAVIENFLPKDFPEHSIDAMIEIGDSGSGSGVVRK